jgi:hypothetical protein
MVSMLVLYYGGPRFESWHRQYLFRAAVGKI